MYKNKIYLKNIFQIFKNPAKIAIQIMAAAIYKLATVNALIITFLQGLIVINNNQKNRKLIK